MPAEGESAGSPSGATPEPSSAAGDRAFISHASADRAIAESLAAYLEERGIGCWMAPRDVAPGALYAEAIIRAISDARALVLILSEHSVASAHVGKELERASSKRRPIIAMRIDAAPLPPAFEYFLSESQWIEAQGPGQEAAFAKLAEALRRPGTASRSTPAGISAARPAARARVGLALGLAAVVAVIVASAFVFLRARQPAPQSTSADLHSIAVLPFADMSQAHDQEYFGDGMADEILDLLAKIPALKVIARSSSFQFKGKSEDLRVVGERLGVATLLEGSVRKAGNHLRITAQLIRATDGSHLWSETYDRDVSDIFRTQDEIAGAVVRALQVSLLGAPQPRAAPTTSTEAYGLYLQGVDRWNRYSAADSKAAADYFRQAIKLDPGFAKAWAALAAAYSDQEVFGSVYGSPEEVQPLIEDAARHAIELDPKLAEAHVALSNILFLETNLADSDRELREALELEPGNVAALNSSVYSSLVGCHLDQAADFARQVIALNPLVVDAYRGLATALWFKGQPREAEAEYRKALSLRPDAEGFRYRLAQILIAEGKVDEALHELALERSVPWQHVGRAMAFDAQRRRVDADREIAELTSRKDLWDYQLAEIFAARGERDSAFKWLDSAYRRHDPGLISYVRCDPMLAGLRDDSRYAALLGKLFPAT